MQIMERAVHEQHLLLEVVLVILVPSPKYKRTNPNKHCNIKHLHIL